MFASLFGCENYLRHEEASQTFDAELNKLSELSGPPADDQTYTNMYEKYVSTATERTASMVNHLLQTFVNSEYAFDEDAWVNVINNCIDIVRTATVRGVCKYCGCYPRSRIGRFRAGIR